MQNEWTTQVQIVYDAMIELQMDQILLYFLILAITTWKTIKHPEHPPIEFDDMYAVLCKGQSNIGWNPHVIYGRLTTAWVDIQNQHEHTQDNGIPIISTGIGKILKIVYHMWKWHCDIKYRKIDQSVYRTNILHPRSQQGGTTIQSTK